MINAKILAQGYLPTASAAIYTCPVSASYLRYFTLYNEGNDTETILISMSGSISCVIGRLSLETLQSSLILSDGETMTIANGQKIFGITSTNPSVQYVIAGGEEV